MSRSDGKTGVGLLSLKWNNYKSIFFETIKTLREKSKYTDATLAVDGHFYHVHKLVMSTCSEYFSDIFEKTPCKAPVIVLKDVSRDEIEGLLSYMYLGEVNVHQNNLASFLKTAESLRIKGLAVSDDQPTNLSKSQTSSRKDASRDSPSLKRQRLENTGSSPAVPPVKSLKKSDTPLAMKVEMNSPEMSKTKQNKPPMVKIGMSDAEEREQRIRTKINYEEDPGSEQETGDVYGPDSPMTDHSPEQEESEHEAENVASTSFFGSAQQQSAENKGEVEWEEEDASSFIPETYMGNVSTSLQTQGPASKPVVKSVGDDEAIIHQLKENLRKVQPVSNMKYEAFRSFCQAMMKVINGGKKIIGYGKPQKMPTWWPLVVPWAKTGFHVLDYADIRLVAHTAYHHHGIPFQDIQVGAGVDANEIQYGGGFETLIVSDDDNQSVGNVQTQSGVEAEIQPDDADGFVAHGRE